MKYKTRKIPGCAHTKENCEYIRRKLEYIPETGELLWKSSSGGRLKGTTAGFKGKDGYVHIHIARIHFRAHRIAWFLFYGEFPNCEIDHIDGNTTNNRIKNLRDVSRRENMCNTRKHRCGKLVGACLHEGGSRKKPWIAQIRVDGKKTTIGHFKTEEEASIAYLEKSKSI